MYRFSRREVSKKQNCSTRVRHIDMPISFQSTRSLKKAESQRTGWQCAGTIRFCRREVSKKQNSLFIKLFHNLQNQHSP
jgi:hypothetical protein